MTALDAIHQWPVDHVGAAAVLPDGSIVTAGEIDTPFALASITKVLVALTTLVAVEDGSVELDEPLGPPGATLRHLLAHASGIDATSERVLTPPATRRIYSNAGFEVIASFLVERTGIDLPTLVTESVLEPLGMNSTVPASTAATGATGTVADLARLATDLMADEPVVISAVTRDQAREVAFPGLSGVLPGFGQHESNDWGLGFEIRGTKDPHWTPPGASPRTFGHFGRSGSLLWVDPDARTALTVLGNRDFGDWVRPLWPELGTEVLELARSAP